MQFRYPTYTILQIANLLLLLALAGACAHLPVTGLPEPLATAREASGGDRWRDVAALESSGTLSVGGLTGEFESLVDVRDGRSITRYRLGPIEGAEGYDGTNGWSQTGSEVVVPDSPEARARARTDAWMNRHGYFDTRGAHYGEPVRRTEDGRHYDVIEAVPEDGAPIELWFDTKSARLTKTVHQEGQDNLVIRYQDYREVAGLWLPFRVVSEGTDPRNRVTVVFERIEPRADTDGVAFERPTDAAGFTLPTGVTAATLPFDLVNNHIYVGAEVDSQPVRLLVDTGGANLLTPAAAARLGLTAEGQMAARGAGEEQEDVAFARAKSLQLGEARFDDPLFYVIDLGELEAVEGLTFDGLVGYEIFHHFAVRIDYAGRELTLTDPANWMPPEAMEVPFVLDGRIPVVEGRIDGLLARFAIDTGSRSSLTVHSRFVREHDLLDRYEARFETVNGWGVGGPSRSWPVRLGSVQLGEAEVRDVVAHLFTGDKGSFANPDVSANVGSGLLRRFVVSFDYRARRMYLEPGADFTYRENYDRAGLWLMGENDALRIGAVAPASPAERVGLREGDRITHIDGQRVTERPLANWRAFLRDSAPGTQVRLELLRGGERILVTLTLADLIEPPGI